MIGNARDSRVPENLPGNDERKSKLIGGAYVVLHEVEASRLVLGSGWNILHRTHVAGYGPARASAAARGAIRQHRTARARPDSRGFRPAANLEARNRSG